MPKLNIENFREATREQLINQLNNAMEIANLGMYEWDVVDDYLILDDYAYKMAGINRDKFNHSMKYIIDYVIHPDSIKDFLASISLKNREQSDSERLNENKTAYRIKHPDKKECYLEFMSRVVVEDGQATRLIGVIKDVTEDVKRENRYKNSIHFIKSLLEAIPSPMFYKDSQGIYRECNEAFSQYIKLPREKIVGKSVYDVAPKELAKIYEDADNRLLSIGGKQSYENDVVDDKGNRKHVIFHKAVHLNIDESVDGIIGLIQDVTLIRQREKHLSRVSDAQKLLVRFNQEMINYNSEKKFFREMLVEFMTLYPQVRVSALLEIDHEGILSIYNAEGLVLVDQDQKMVFSDSLLYELINEDYESIHKIGPINFAEMPSDDIGRDVMKNNPIKANIAIPITSKGNIRWLYMFSAFEEDAFDDMDMELAEFIRAELHILMDVFKLFQKTVRMARYDGLTGLMNRVYFDESFRAKLMNEPNENFNVVLIDLDNLKYVNDRYGHNTGDLYISYLSTFIKMEFMNDAFFGRIGGDELAGVVVNCHKDKLIERLESIQTSYGNRIRDLLKDDIGGFSYGIAEYPKDGSTYKTLLKKADMRMYAQKEAKSKDKRQ